MFEQDYIMRLIKEMVRAILKLLFHIDTESQMEELLEEREEKEVLQTLLDMIDKGDINEAENKLYDLTEKADMENLKIALLFYSYLNDKDNDFLLKHGFSREEIKSGIQNLVSKYGLDDMAAAFLADIPD